MDDEIVKPVWAICELLGRVAMAGRFSRSEDYPGLFRIDIPMNGTYRTEFFSAQAVYRIRPVSEEIARAFDQPRDEVLPLNVSVVLLEEHELALRRMQDLNTQLSSQVGHLQRELNRMKERHQAAECGTVGLDDADEDDGPDPVEDGGGPDLVVDDIQEEDDIPF